MRIKGWVCISFRKCNYSYYLYLQNYIFFKICGIGISTGHRLGRDILKNNMAELVYNISNKKSQFRKNANTSWYFLSDFMCVFFQFKWRSIIKPRYLTYVVCYTGLLEISRLIVDWVYNSLRRMKITKLVLSIIRDSLFYWSHWLSLSNSSFNFESTLY